MTAYASAGTAARAQTDLNMLLLQARKMVRSENDLPNKQAKEKDLEFSRALDNATQQANLVNENIKQGFTIAKVGLAFFKLAAGGIKALQSSQEAAKAADQASAAAQEAALQAQKDLADAVSLGFSTASQVISAVIAFSEIAKNNRNRETLAAEAASVDAATQALDSSGKA